MAALTAANTLHYQTQYPVRLVGYTIDDKTYWIATDRRASSLYLLASLRHREISRAAGIPYLLAAINSLIAFPSRSMPMAIVFSSTQEKFSRSVFILDLFT